MALGHGVFPHGHRPCGLAGRTLPRVAVGAGWGGAWLDAVTRRRQEPVSWVQ